MSLRVLVAEWLTPLCVYVWVGNTTLPAVRNTRISKLANIEIILFTPMLVIYKKA